MAVFLCDVRMQYGFAAQPQTPILRHMIEDKIFYRIHIAKFLGTVDVLSLEMRDVDDPLNGTYDELSDLPQWMQERIAMLSMLSYEPPTETVPGVGRRISEYTYWVEKPDPCD